VRYYQPEHESAYREIERRGHTQWNDLFNPGEWTYDNDNTPRKAGPQ
jgi:hypothetical protein